MSTEMLAMAAGRSTRRATRRPGYRASPRRRTAFAAEARVLDASDLPRGRRVEAAGAAACLVRQTRNGGPVALWGHSYGCNPAMGGAALSANVGYIVIYEPSLGLTYPPGAVDAIEQAVAAGDPERAIRAAFVDTGVMSDEDFEAFKASPRWPNVVASAPTLPRECQVESGWVYQPGQFVGISAPTLMLTGSDTDPEVAACTKRAAAAIPNARIQVLDGHGHFAYKSDPAVVAAIIRGFIAT